MINTASVGSKFSSSSVPLVSSSLSAEFLSVSFFSLVFLIFINVKSQTSTKPTSSLKRPSVVVKGNKAAADLGDGLSSIPVKVGGAGPGQPAVSTGLSVG